MKEGDIQHKIDQCANAENYCYAQARIQIHISSAGSDWLSRFKSTFLIR